MRKEILGKENNMKIELWPIDQVKPYPGNPRKIPQAAIDKVALSIGEYGFRQPIVVDRDGVIIVGHVRWLGARKRGLTHVPVHAADNLTPAQVRGYRLMDNRSHQETDWMPERLKTEIVALDAAKFPLNFTGFLRREIDELLVSPEAENYANSGTGGSSQIITEPGELWQCGAHRVLCGDATNPEHVTRLLVDTCPLLMVIDPPYGVQYEPEWREEAGLGKQVQVGKVANDDRVDWTAAYTLFPGDVAYVWHAGLHASEVAAHLGIAGYEIRSQIIWAKPHFALSRGMYHWQHENCWVAVRKGHGLHWRGSRTQSTLWSVPSLNPFGRRNTEETATGHAAQKPVELTRRPMLNHTEPGEIVYDAFLGSGTTLIAAEMNGRICYGLEIERKYVDLIVRRWQDFTGRLATLEGDGRSFDEIKALRG
jgi:DNA modification methylase